jgi:uncharacterized protein YyaL (SSP411 family)
MARHHASESAGANRLINETSPYLLQHAHNPVDWRPWGEEAFEAAQATGRPIFLSIGYSTCYWCHVMERDCFEDADVAKALNENFVPIKVDREERPDLDEHYMLAAELLTGRGGWPNSVWLTPEGRPWFGATYVPREQFLKLLAGLAQVWRTRRADVQEQATQLDKAIGGILLGRQGEPGGGGAPGQELVDHAIDILRESFDAEQGGFGGAPKFPPHGALLILLHEFAHSRNGEMLAMATRTLDVMARGGIRDHLGGGFHRYSTDERWLVPHFEKMLYDNAQLILAYARAHELTGKKQYREVVAQIVQWLGREMTDGCGGFFSAMDAGDVGQEGSFYIWRHDEIMEALGLTHGKLFAQAYGVTKEGNFVDPHSAAQTTQIACAPGDAACAAGEDGDAVGNILHAAGAVEDIARQEGKSVAAIEAKLARARQKLLEVRNGRSHPHTDDKVLAAWNGLTIQALAYAGRTMGERKYVEMAAAAADFILDGMLIDGRLMRSYRAGQTRVEGFLEDYAFLAWGLVELHRADGGKRWLAEAARLADDMLDRFEDTTAGGFYFTSAATPQMPVRSKSLLGGGNLPSANGVAAIMLLELGQLTKQAKYSDAAGRTLRALAPVARQSPSASQTIVLATQEWLAGK